MQTIASIVVSLAYWTVVLCVLAVGAVAECFPNEHRQCPSGTMKTVGLIAIFLVATILYGIIFYLIDRGFAWWRQRSESRADGR
jgi:uncharacterized membrane protein YhaH (DUF805 family)